jgi:hypothetical protein
MLSSIDKTIILSGSIVGSVFLFSNSLYHVNDILSIFILRRNSNNYYKIYEYNEYEYNKNYVNKLLAINSVTMLFSGSLLYYFTYNAIK